MHQTDDSGYLLKLHWGKGYFRSLAKDYRLSLPCPPPPLRVMNKLLEQAREWKLQNSKSVSQRHVYLYAKILNSQKYPCCFLSHSVVRSPFLSVKLFFEAEMQDGPLLASLSS